MSELKTMKTWFKLPVCCMPSDIGGWMEHVNFGVKGLSSHHCEAIEDAINNHDRLVEENQRLTAIATKHATVNDELIEKQKSDIEKMLDQLFKHEKVDAWLVCKMNDMLDDVNHQLDKSRIEAEKGDGICN